MSHHRRFFCPTDLGCPPWSLGADEARHALKVLRLRVGDEIALLDGRGGSVRARLTHLAGDHLVAEPLGPVDRTPEPAIRPWLLVGAPEPPTLDSVVEHAVELGAWRILVARVERTPAPFPSLERRRARWEGLVRSAGKQSGNPWFPEVVLYPSLAHAAAVLPRAGALLTQGSPPLTRMLPAHGEIVLAVGPEGDFTGEEADLLESGGLLRASLGSHTLRVETACLAALAALAAGGDRGRQAGGGRLLEPGRD